MSNPITIGLIGFGTVGQGVYEIIKQNQAIIQQRIGRNIQITQICVRNKEVNITKLIVSENSKTD